jgi:cysteine-rich repeat protein
LSIKQGAVGRCEDSCGNGFHLEPSVEQCDDSNNANGDGCNSLCNIEPGYYCTRLSPWEKDTCLKTFTGIRAIRTTKRNNVYIEFEDKVYIVNG